MESHVSDHQIGRALRAARKQKCITLRDLEHLSGMPASHISSIETGVRRDPAFGSIVKLARALGISIDDLLGGNDSAANSASGEYAYAELRRLRKQSARCIARIDELLASLGVPIE